MESEFFGHIKGSFTGANSDKEGLFHAANSGTLFLDEVAELPLDMQVKLLRVIQEKAVRPVGAPKESHIDVRILSATHRNLAERVKSGFFREDLFYRINVIELKIPSLRQRPDDIAILITHLVEKICNNMGLPQPLITKEAISKLEAYRFPGNVRELENILERAVTLCENDTITPDDIKLSGIRKITDIEEDSYQSKSIREGSLDDYIAEIEKREIIEALESCKYNKTAAAEQLGITFRSLRYRIKRLGIED
jgi:two-component system response regulator PilR (NtrC family)